MTFWLSSPTTMPGNSTYSSKQSASWEYSHYASDSKEATALWLNTDGRLGRQDVRCANRTYIPALNYDPQPPFTPCLTPTSSIGSSAASSPRFLVVTPCEEEGKLLTRQMQSHPSGDSSDGNSTRFSIRSSASPHLSQTLPPPKERPTRFIQHQDARYSQSSAASPVETRPKKKARSSGPTFAAYSPSTSTVNVPPARPSELTFDPVKKTSKESSSRNSRRRRGGSETDSQPIKFRFVSVQHSTEVGDSSSGAAEDEEQRIRLEEHMEEDVDEGPFEHGPTEFPPRPYAGGEYADSPLRPKRPMGKIPASNLDFLPFLEARFARLETAVDRYVNIRAQQALKNSQLPSGSSRKPSNSPPKSP